MKKYLIVLSMLVCGLSVASASILTPKDNTGKSLDTIDWLGALPCNMDASTTTAAALCTNLPAVVYGVVVSSIPASNYLVLRDSATANLTSSTATIVYATVPGAISASGQTQSNLVVFPRPIRFANGISANLSATAPAAGANGATWTILYRLYKSNE